MRTQHLLVSLILLMLTAGPLAAQANRLVRVPQDAKNLGAAIDKVADGGVIEMAAGSYATPPNGFPISNKRKGFTIRAAAGAAVALDGGGTRTLVRFVNSDRARGKRVTFERLIFRNGFSSDNNESGGVTVQKADAVFRGCTFLNNRTGGKGTGGGAVKVFDGSVAAFVNSSFRDNSALSRGGALVVRAATVTIQGGELLRNRTNGPGHNLNAAGGAIIVLDGTLTVSNVRFEGNEAGWVGGAIYAIGAWTKGSTVSVTGSTFVANQAVGNPCCANPAPTTGGAIHVEDLTTLKVQSSLFLRNRADTGGAVDNYRAVAEISGSVFQGNQTTLVRPTGGAGGAISVFSSDFSDASTGSGAINRRSARLVITQSLLQGGDEVAQDPQGGGCLLVAGDSARMYGGGQVTAGGTLEVNRAQVEIRGTVFHDCDVQQAATGGGGAGGAITADLANLLIEDSMIFHSDARGSNAAGGGLALRQETLARIQRTTFARNSAERFGGAIFTRGSTLEVSASRFYRNRVAQGLSSILNDARGAAVFSIPLSDPVRPRSASGVVSGSIFSENEGIPVWDVDPPTGPPNEMRHNGNRFNPIVFGDRVYVNSTSFPGGANVAELNGFTRKVQVPNERIFNPREGVLLVVPSPNAVGANPPLPARSVVGYAWTGGSATLGIPLPDRAGLLELGPGNYTLTVDGAAVATTGVLSTCTRGSVLCLAGNRFRAELTWKNGAATSTAQAVSLSSDTGSFWFTDPANTELVLKVLDGRAINGHFWVFYGGLTNLPFSLTLTDSVTGEVKTYTSPSGRFASVGDTSAFQAPAGVAGSVDELTDEFPSAAEPFVPSFDEAGTCAAGPATLCLSRSRVRVELSWKDGVVTRTAQAVPLSGDTGYFFFGSAANVEVIVKVLDARTVNNHFWVFFGALSNLEYTLTVTDTETGRTKTYHNPSGRFTSQGDTSALPGN